MIAVASALVLAASPRPIDSAEAGLRADPPPSAWPGGGRFLTDPLVVGSNLVGQGALVIQDGVVTEKQSNHDDAPPELSLRSFAFVDHGASGYSAVFRFLHPIVQLHEWRRIAVRHTIGVVLTSPDGAAHEVLLQPDGTTSVGDLVAGAFTPTGSSLAVIAGNVAVVDVPASMGVTADWTVQGIVRVEADTRLHPNNSINFDTGYVAGTSIVPVSLLTGGAAATEPSTTSFTGAVSDLASTDVNSPTEVPDPIRPVSIRFEGEGVDLVAVVTLAAAPDADPASTGSLYVDLATPGVDPLASAVNIGWRPGPAGSPVPDASVSLGGVGGTAPVTVSGRDVRIALGAYTPDASPPASTSSPTVDELGMDQLDGEIAVILSRDETVSSLDGNARFVAAATAAEAVTYPAPVKPQDDATITLSGGAVSVRRASTGSIATGFIRADGGFFATNATESYSGVVERQGGAMIYDASVGPGPDGSIPSDFSIPVTDDLSAASLASTFTAPILIGETTMKGDLANPPQLVPHIIAAVSDPSWITRLGADAATTTGGSPLTDAPDWPVVPIATSPSTGLQTTTGPFVVRMSAFASTGDTTRSSAGVWISSTHVDTVAAPAVVPAAVATTVVAATSVLPATDDPSAPIASIAPSASSVAPPALSPATAVAATTPISTADGEPTSSIGWVIVLIAVAGVGGAAAYTVARRRKRSATPPPPTQPHLRSSPGVAQYGAAPSDGGHDLGLRSTPGTSEHSANERVGAS